MLVVSAIARVSVRPSADMVDLATDGGYGIDTQGDLVCSAKRLDLQDARGDARVVLFDLDFNGVLSGDLREVGGGDLLRSVKSAGV